MRGGSTWGQRAVALLGAVAVAAVVAGCGARLDDEQMAAALGQQEQQGSASTAAPAAGVPLDAAAAPSAGADPGSAPPAGAEPGAAQPAAAPAAAAAGEAACRPAGGGEVGVTATEIVIANVATISGPVPGLGQTAHNGSKAYVNYINSQGGVCGRKVKLLAVDDRFDSGTNRAETQRLMGQALAFAGAWSVVDDGGASVLQGTNVPDATLGLSGQRISLPNNFSPNPIDLSANTNATDRMFAHFKATEGISKGAVVWGAQSSARKRAQSFKADMERAGIQVVVEAETAVTQTDYTGVATQIKNAGADVVITALELGAMAKLAQALKQQSYVPKVPFYGAQAYGRKFLQLAGAAAEGTKLGLAYTPVEDAGANPGIALFKQWYERTSPGAEMDFFAITSWASTKLLLDAVAEAGPNPTRDQVLAKLRGKTDFDGGGVLAPKTNPAQKKASPCFLVVAVEGGKWVRKHPATGYDCG